MAESNRTRAEALFERAKKITQTLHEAEASATHEKTLRLRALRLARDAAERDDA
jgi:hypothetical protein